MALYLGQRRTVRLRSWLIAPVPKGLVPTKSQPRGQSILIVEDDPISRDAMEKILRQFGHIVITVASVAESLERLDGQDCAILDLNLPDGVGTTVIQRIRDENRPMRVAVVTGSSDEALLATARAFAPQIILRKPLNLSVLLNWLDEAG